MPGAAVSLDSCPAAVPVSIRLAGVRRRSAPPLVLASGSAGRLAVLRSAGIDPEVVVSGVDETYDDHLETAALVAVLAERKAAAVASIRPDALVLGCDSVLD